MFVARRFPALMLTLLGLGFLQHPIHAATPTDPAEKAKIIGQPQGLILHPATISLSGPRSTQQLVVTGKYADGSVRDLTAFVEAGRSRIPPWPSSKPTAS